MGAPREISHPTTLLPPFSDEARRWQAVQDRDAAADGLFVYAVKTTKIYCRPICKARLARRANVSFYDTGRAAQAAGFRACKRCKPELAGAMPAELAVRKIRAFVEEQQQQRGRAAAGRGTTTTTTTTKAGSVADTRLSLSQMARQTGLSKWHFHRVFKRCVGVTPSEFLRRRGEAALEEEEEESSLSPPTSGTLSPWRNDLELDSALGWLMPGDDMTGHHDVDFAMFDVESTLMPWNDNGFDLDDANLTFDDFLIWPKETCKNVPV